MASQRLTFRERIAAEGPAARRRLLAAWFIACLLFLVGLAISRWRNGSLTPAALALGALAVAALAVSVSWHFKPNIWTIFGREFRALFYSPIAYLVLLGIVIVTGVNFAWLVEQMRRGYVELGGDNGPMVAYQAYSLWFWITQILLFPLITMRLMSEEQRSGTLETLLTAPVTEAELVLGKYFACWAFYPLLLAPSALLLGVLARRASFDLWPVLACYVGELTLGAMFVAIGVFFSSLTRNQIIAAVGTSATLIVLFSVAMLSYETSRYLSVLYQLGDLAQGKMDVRYLVMHLSVAAWTLFVTVKLLEVRRGR